MTRKEFAAALRAQTEDVRLSPQLRSRIISAACGKEQRIMKRKIPVIALAVVMSLLCCAVALAAANRAGMLDFLNQYDNLYLPEGIEEGMKDAIQQDVLETGSDVVDVSVRELYYDGVTARLTVDVTPKNEEVMLIALDTLVTDAWSDVNRLNPDFDQSDARTVQEAFREGGFTAGYTLSAGLHPSEGEIVARSSDYSLMPDGTLTLFIEESFALDKPKRDVTFRLTVKPAIDADGEALDDTDDQRVFIDQSLTLSSAVGVQEMYVNEAPVILDKTGIAIEHFLVEVKPTELYVTCVYTQTETELSKQHPYGKPENGTLDEYFVLELIDPASTAEQPHEQALPRGLTDSGLSWKIDTEAGEPERFVRTFSIARDQLHDSYTVRVYDFATKERYESAVVPMREATDADAALLSDYEIAE